MYIKNCNLFLTKAQFFQNFLGTVTFFNFREFYLFICKFLDAAKYSIIEFWIFTIGIICSLIHEYGMQNVRR